MYPIDFDCSGQNDTSPQSHTIDTNLVQQLFRPSPLISPSASLVAIPTLSPGVILPATLKITPKHPVGRALAKGGLFKGFRAAPQKLLATFFIEKHHVYYLYSPSLSLIISSSIHIFYQFFLNGLI
jgi:hypothetical protein